MMSATGNPNDRSITLASTMGVDEWDIIVPANVDILRLIKSLLKKPELGFKVTDDNGNLIPYRLLWSQGERYLGETETLAMAGVADGHKLVMAHEPRAGCGNAVLRSGMVPDN